MAQQLDIKKYTLAIQLVEAACNAGTPIIRTKFTAKEKLDARLFVIMEEFKIIEKVSESKMEGAVFKWIHKKASNESDTFLATRITGEIYRLNQVAYHITKTPEYQLKKKNRVKKQYEESQKAKAERERKEQEDEELQQKIAAENRAKEEQIKNKLLEELKEQGLITPPDEPKVKKYNKVSYSLSGNLNKEELLRKIEELIEAKDISSFELNVEY